MPASLPPALVLAAGLGRRLSPLTNVRAKPAVPVAGRALVLRILDWLARQGVVDVVLNLHHRPETITRLVGYGAAAGLRVRYSWEPAILGSAGGPRQALPYLGPRFFIVNGDTLTDLALRDLLDHHRDSRASVTLGVTGHPDPERYGGVLVAPDGRVRGFTRAGGAGSAHFIGVQLAESSVFAGLPHGQPASTIGGLYDRLAREADGRWPGGLRARAVRVQFLDAGTPADYLGACLAVAAGEGQPAPAAGAGATIHPTAVVTRTVVWDRVAIGPRCRLEECIVADDVRLPAGTALRRAICIAGREASAGRHDRVIGNARICSIDASPAAAP